MADDDLISMTEADHARGVAATAAAIDSVRIEGMTVSREVVAIMERQSRGEISTDEAIAFVHAYHATL